MRGGDVDDGRQREILALADGAVRLDRDAVLAAGVLGGALLQSVGWISNWFTAGTMSEFAMSSSRWCGMKFDTPIARTAPSAYSFSKAFQVSPARPLLGTGQWIR